jgi:hypothetical protein
VLFLGSRPDRILSARPRGLRTRDDSGQVERQLVRAMLQRESLVARQMRQTRLIPLAMLLLRGIAIRDPDLRLMAADHVGDDAVSARIGGVGHDRVFA